MIRSASLLMLATINSVGFLWFEAPSPRWTHSKIRLSCMIFRHDVFGDGIEWGTHPPILNDLDTYFLIDLPKGTKSTPIEVGIGETTRISDTFGDPVASEFLLVTANVAGDKTRLTIASSEKSALKMDSAKEVEIPNLGSTIVRAANLTSKSESIYVWIMVCND